MVERESEAPLNPTSKYKRTERKRKNILEVFTVKIKASSVLSPSLPLWPELMCACCLDTSRPVCPVPSGCCLFAGVVIVVVILMIMMLFMMRSGSINNLSSAVARPTQDPLDQQPDKTHPPPLQRHSKKKEKKERRGKKQLNSTRSPIAPC